MILKDIDKVTMKASGMDDQSNKVIRHLINGFVIEESPEPFITEAQKKLRANLLKQSHGSCKRNIQKKSKTAVTCVKATSSQRIKSSDSISSLRVVKPADSDLKNDLVITTNSCMKNEASKGAVVVDNIIETAQFDENIPSCVAPHTHLTSDPGAASSSASEYPEKHDTSDEAKVQKASNENNTTSPPKVLISAANSGTEMKNEKPENVESDIVEMDISETVDITVVLDASKNTAIPSNVLNEKASIAGIHKENVTNQDTNQEVVTCSFENDQNEIKNSQMSEPKSRTEDKEMIVEHSSVSHKPVESSSAPSLNGTERLLHSSVFTENASTLFNVNTSSSEALVKTLEHDKRMDTDELVLSTESTNNHSKKDHNVSINDKNVACASNSNKSENVGSKTDKKDSCIEIEHTNLSSTPKKISKPVNDWSVDDVFEFLRSVNELSRFANEFKLQEIDGEALLLLELDHLMNSMSFPLGPALKLIDNIKKKDKLFSQ